MFYLFFPQLLQENAGIMSQIRLQQSSNIPVELIAFISVQYFPVSINMHHFGVEKQVTLFPLRPGNFKFLLPPYCFDWLRKIMSYVVTVSSNDVKFLPSVVKI